jgi:hypothetical protein
MSCRHCVFDPPYHFTIKVSLLLLDKKVLLVLLAEKMLDLVAQAFLVLLVVLFLFLGGSSTVASVFLLVDVAFASTLDYAVSQRDRWMMCR